MEDKAEFFAEKITAIKTESQRAIAEAKQHASNNIGLPEQIRQDAFDTAKRIEFLDMDHKKSALDKDALSPPDGSPLSVCAQDIMKTEIAWCSKEDSVENALDQMQQLNTGYMLVGEKGVIEGIVSKSDLKGALSPYLLPQFAKWRRPLDDATLQIRVKWVMSKPVHTVGCVTSLPAILNEIRQLDVLCFPVIDKERQVVGILTKAEIFDALATVNKETTHQKTSSPPYSHSSYRRKVSVLDS